MGEKTLFDSKQRLLYGEENFLRLNRRGWSGAKWVYPVFYETGSLEDLTEKLGVGGSAFSAASFS